MEQSHEERRCAYIKQRYAEMSDDLYAVILRLRDEGNTQLAEELYSILVPESEPLTPCCY